MRNCRALPVVGLAGILLLTGCFGKKHQAPVAGTSAEPDTVLFARANDDIKHGRYTVGRLGLQTLINTYPDSEYLAKAKLAIADSYYKEGGTAGLKQAIVEYKDFITFFPFLDEAAYSQMQVGMAHYRQMEKPDRDHSEAVEAEAEFQTFMEKYPTSTLAPQAEQRLREVQEVLAEGNFRIAQFYYVRGARRAAAARLIDLSNRYPLYSHADTANWMLAQIYEKIERNDVAARYYTKIVREYPLSPLATDAKARLTKFGAPVPQADPDAVARMQSEEKDARERPGKARRSLGILKRGPDVTTAARTGSPTLTPESDSGNEPVAIVPTTSVAVSGPAGTVGSTATVETVTPGSPSSLAQPAASTTDPAPASTAPGSDSTTSTPSTDTSSATSTGTSSDSNSTTQTQTTAPAQSTTPAQPADTSQESTSKKKKGIHKLIPF